MRPRIALFIISRLFVSSIKLRALSRCSRRANAAARRARRRYVAVLSSVKGMKKNERIDEEKARELIIIA